MKIVFRQTQLYKFLQYCNQTGLEKKVLDCGAGGNCPPLALFRDFGYQTAGIEISDRQLQKADQFSRDNGLQLNIIKGDMRNLPFADQSFSFVYSYNTIFHLNKAEIAKTVTEIKRVLKPGGLCFINFASVNDDRYGEGELVSEGEYLHLEDGEKVLHTYYKEDEADILFSEMDLLFKENRVLHRIFQGELIKQGYIDYICKKKIEII